MRVVTVHQFPQTAYHGMIDFSIPQLASFRVDTTKITCPYNLEIKSLDEHK